jgi:hypothetical protein
MRRRSDGGGAARERLDGWAAGAVHYEPLRSAQDRGASRCSSVAEQLFRKQQAVGSSPTTGSSPTPEFNGAEAYHLSPVLRFAARLDSNPREHTSVEQANEQGA